MKYIKIASLLIASIAMLATIGSVVALKEWSNQYVAASLSVKTIAPLPQIRTQGKVLAPKVISLVIKESASNYAQMTIRELKALWKGSGVKNWSRLGKAALIESLANI